MMDVGKLIQILENYPVDTKITLGNDYANVFIEETFDYSGNKKLLIADDSHLDD
jgi:hypothetical protein